MSQPSDISIKITDRNGNKHLVKSPIDMALNLMEVIRMHELAPEGSIGVCGGMAMSLLVIVILLVLIYFLKKQMKKMQC